MNLRDRRMEEEWQLLEALTSANPRILAQITRSSGEFRVVLKESPAWISEGSELKVEIEHAVRYVYPRYYPALPIDGYFVRPIAHVNVDPVTGFVCLWERYQASQTIVDAVLITRAIMACRIANHDPAHCMQSVECAPLPDAQPFIVPEQCRPVLLCRKCRQRLSTGQMPQEENRALSYIE